MSLSVSFSNVLRHSSYITRNRQPRSRTHLTCAEPRRADMESVLARVMTPRLRERKVRVAGYRGQLLTLC